MTSLGVAAQSAMPSAGATAAAVGDHGAGKHRSAHDSAVFDALLGALGDANAEPQAANGNNAKTAPPQTTPTIPEADASTAPTASISAIHSLGSGVLVAFDKRLSASSAQKDEPAASEEAPKTDAQATADASTLTSLGWAALIMSATGAGQNGAASAPAATTGASKSSATVAAAATSAAKTLPGATDDAKNQAAMPSNAATLNAAPAIALNAGQAPVDVTVTRSITYLGLDPTVREAGGDKAPTSVSTAPRASAAASGGPHAAPEENATPRPLANASNSGASSDMAGGQQPEPQTPSGAKGGRASNDATSGKATSSSAPSASNTVGGATNVAQPTLSASPASDIPVIGLIQLSDVIANAAQSLAPQSSDTAASAKTSVASSPASMAPVKELDVQLNPASLGALSIEMRLSNGNLTVTIKADKSDTLKLIDNERSAISDKLKSLNFSVESLTVKALDASAPNGATTEASNSGTANHGEAQQGQSGQSADGSQNKDRSLQGGGDQGRPRQQARSAFGDSGGDGNPGHRFV